MSSLRTINGKRDHFTRAELLAVGKSIGYARPQDILDEVTEAVSQWPGFAHAAGVPDHTTKQIARQHRLALSE